MPKRFSVTSRKTLTAAAIMAIAALFGFAAYLSVSETHVPQSHLQMGDFYEL